MRARILVNPSPPFGGAREHYPPEPLPRAGVPGPAIPTAPKNGRKTERRQTYVRNITAATELPRLLAKRGTDGLAERGGRASGEGLHLGCVVRC
jgi:hypothetical protein